jgi:cytochrome c oxidase subunit 2
MTALIIILCIILITVVLVQIGRVTELTGQIKGEREVLRDSSKWNGLLSVGFMVVFLGGCVLVGLRTTKMSLLGYGPHKSASAARE